MNDQPRPDAPATSVAFADAARAIAQAARTMPIEAPSFRCPPKVVGVDRAVRRRGDRAGQAVVSVRLKGRPWVPVLADMIEGVVVANRLSSPDADRVRGTLWNACGYRLSEEDATDAHQQRGVGAGRAA